MKFFRKKIKSNVTVYKTMSGESKWHEPRGAGSFHCRATLGFTSGTHTPKQPATVTRANYKVS